MPETPGAGVIRAVGDRACLIELPDLGNVLRVAERIRALSARGALSGIVDVVPAARTVLVACDGRESLRRATSAVPGVVADAVDGAEAVDGAGSIQTAAERDGSGRIAATIVIDIVYDGADLDAVAEYTGLSRDGVVAAHVGADWRAAFGGFAPGFVYLAGGDPRLRVPRLDAPRPSVPAGSVAIAGEFSAVYPSASPGGWRLLGRTAARVWDPSGERAALIAPGDTVRFRAVHDRVDLREVRGAVSDPSEPDSTEPVSTAPLADLAGDPGTGASGADSDASAVTVVDPALLSLIQDDGRPGFAAVGVTGSGAMDRSALAAANRAVGNPPGAAAIETVAGGLALRAERGLTVAVAGGDAALLLSTGRTCVAGAPVRLLPGETARVAAPSRGFRSYVAFGGGLEVEAVLGSSSADQLSGLGPAPLRAGDRLRVGVPAAGGGARPAEEAAPGSGSLRSEPLSLRSAATSLRSAPTSLRPEPTSLRFVPGPRDDWFEPVALTALAGAAWTVTPRSNRVGARLDGPPLPRARHDELLSEGAVAGSIQVPPDGRPVLFLADHPVTGGYPVIGTVVADDLDLAGQLAPGDAVRFAPVDVDGVPLRGPASGALQAQPLTAFSIEVDGRRRGIRIPPDLAAIIAGLLESPDEAPLREAIAALVGSIAAMDEDAAVGPERTRRGGDPNR